MQNYKAPDGSLHQLDDAAFEHMLPAGCKRISAEEYVQATAPSAQELILLQIMALEATVTQRRLREAALGEDGGWLADLNAKIVALRAQL
jgi:hypothetical protein